MKAKDGLPAWVWVAGPAAILLAALVLLALFGEGRTEPETASDIVTYEDVAENPQRFYGETVTVRGWVGTVLGPRSLLMNRRFVTGDLLVVSGAPLRQTLARDGEAEEDVALEHATVWVTGEVRRFDLARAEGEVEANLKDDALDAYVGTPAIIADSVSLERRRQRARRGRPRGPWKEGAEGGGPGLPGRSGGAAALWMGQAASIPITRAANLSYRLRGACPIITFGFTLFATALTLTVFNLGAYASRPTGLPEPAAAAPRRLALGNGLHHRPAPPDARLPFKWATSGGFIATVLIFASSTALGYHVADPGGYDQVYGQLEAAIVFIMLWLHTTGTWWCSWARDKRRSGPHCGGEERHRTRPDEAARRPVRARANVTPQADEPSGFLPLRRVDGGPAFDENLRASRRRFRRFPGCLRGLTGP